MGKQQKILIVRGTFDENKLRSIQKFEGCILATGEVIFKEEAVIPCTLIATDIIKANKLTIKGTLICEGKCKVEELNVHGDLSIVQRSTEIKKLTLGGALLSDRDKVLCSLMQGEVEV